MRAPSCSSVGSRLSASDILYIDDDEGQDETEKPVEIEHPSIIKEFACAMVQDNLVQSCLKKTAEEMTEEKLDVEHDDTENQFNNENPYEATDQTQKAYDEDDQVSLFILFDHKI